MSTKYFILTKPKDSSINITDNSKNQIVFLNDDRNCYFLPQNLMTCYYENGLFESNIIEWCKQFCSLDKVMLDIGAHTGTYGISLSESCKKVYCFEPQEMTYYALCGSVALSNKTNIKCLNIGLGSTDQVGKCELNIISNDGGGSSMHTFSETKILRKEEIIVETLDNLKISDIGFIKMDVENNEYFVLLGAKNTLEFSNYPPILFECNNKEENAVLFEYIQNIGYRIIQITGVNNMYLASTK